MMICGISILYIADLVESLKKGDKQITLDVLRRTKDQEKNISLYEPLIEEIAGVSNIFIVWDRLIIIYIMDLLI